MSTAARATAACSDHHHCVTCADEGVPMTVLRVDEAAGLALCSAGEGERATIEVALVGPLSAGDSVLVHAGTAIAMLGGAPHVSAGARA